MHTRVINPNGTHNFVKNLGWLLRNRRKHGGIEHVFGNALPKGRGILIVIFEDKTTYISTFESFTVMVNWITRFLVKYTENVQIKEGGITRILS